MVVPQTEITINLDGVELVRTTVEPGGYVIGADPAADIVAPADGVARYHAHLTVTPSEMRIQDLGSESGTYVAGSLASESVRIWPNQKVLIGPAVLEARRVRSSDIEQSLSPPAVAVRRILPEEFLRGRKYEIGGTLGQGGMGAVLSAREATTHRTVAMKVMLANISETDVIRFIAEAQITSQLEHPNIVPVHELGVDEHDQVFYTMKHVQGVNLRTVLEKLRARDPETCAAYPLRRLLVVLLRVCDAMAFAHSRGVLHRDLKPENVMIGDFGEVLVMDWGLAKVLGTPAEPIGDAAPAEPTAPLSTSVSSARGLPTASLTVVGSLVGTPHYMSPEQARCEVETLDERSDVWSLGAILRYILSLTVPVPGDRSDEIAANVRAGILTPIPPQAHHCPGGRVPESLIAVANKAQALPREDRYQSASEFRSEIDAYLGGFATNAERATALRQLWLLMLRHRAVTGVLVALFVLSIVFVVRLMASEHRAEESAETARRNERTAQKSERHARNAQADAIREKEAARQALARSQVSLADAAYRESNSVAMLAALESVPPDLRDSDWRYLRAHAENSLARVTLPKGAISIGSAAHPKRPGVFAVAITNGTILLVDGGSGQTLQVLKATPRQERNIWFRALSFSPDGTRLAVGTLGNGGVAVYRVEDGKCVAEWPGDSVDVVEFSKDGTEVLAVHGNGDLTVNDAETGALRWKYRSCMRAAYAPGGNVVVASGSSIRLLDKETQAVIREFPPSRASVTWLTLSPNAEILYAASRDGVIRGMKFSDGTTTFEARLNERGGWPRLAVSADGRCLIAASGAADRYRAVRAWDTETGILLSPFLGAESNVESVAMHPLTDEFIATGADTRTWSLASRAPRWTLKNGASAVFWNSDDLFFAGAMPLTLKPDGSIAPPPWKWAPEWRSFLANTGGDHAVVARGGSGGGSSKWFGVLKKSPGKVEQLHSFETKTDLRYIRMSPDGSRFAFCDYYALLETRDTATAQAFPRCNVHQLRTVTGLAWLTNQRMVGIATYNNRGGPGWEERIVLWDVDTGKLLRSVTHPTIIDAIAAPADGRIFAEAGSDKKVRLRDPETLHVVREFRAHDGPITALAFHPSRPILATGSADSTIRLWNLQDDTMTEEIRTTQKEPHWLQFSPTGTRLASADPEGNVCVWDLTLPAVQRPPPPQRTPAEEAAEARQRGEASGRNSKWGEARSAFAEARRLDPAEESSCHRLAPLLVQLNDHTAGRLLGREMLDRFQTSQNPLTLERTAKAALLLPLDDADRARAVQLGRAAGSHTTHPLFPFLRFAKGFAQYRAGEYAGALETLQTFQGRPAAGTLEVHALAVVAMTLHRSGQFEEARAALAAAREAALNVLPHPDSDQNENWHDVLTARLLVREAEGMIDKK